MNFYMVAWGLFLVFLGLSICNYGFFPNKNDYVKKTDVVKALSGDWKRFYFQNPSNIPFYEAEDIDSRIDKLNKVLKDGK